MSETTDKITDAAIALGDAVSAPISRAIADARKAGLPDHLIEAVLSKVISFEMERA